MPSQVDGGIPVAADPEGAEDQASSGMVRFYGAWDLVGRESGNSGAFVWKVENRHGYTDVAPSGFSFELGNIGLFVPPFSDQGLRLTNLYWRQRFLGDRLAKFEIPTVVTIVDEEIVLASDGMSLDV